MDFLERIFGISPDGGNGLDELVFVVSLAVLAVWIRDAKFGRN